MSTISMLFKFEYAYESPEDLVVMKMLIQDVWDEGQYSYLLTTLQVMLMLIVPGLHFEERGTASLSVLHT